MAHGTKRVHKQASSSCSAVENLQPQQLQFFLDCFSRRLVGRLWHTESYTNSVCGITFRAKMQ